MKLKKYREENRALESAPFVASIQLNSTDTSPRIEYPAYSYIDIDQGERVVFPARKAYPGFPGGTPKGLEEFRQKELADLRVWSSLCHSSEVVLLQPMKLLELMECFQQARNIKKGGLYNA